MDNRFSSRRYRFNDLNSSPYQRQRRFGQGAKKKEQKRRISYKSSPNPFPPVFRERTSSKNEPRCMEIDVRTYMYIRATASRTRGGIRGRAGERTARVLPPSPNPTARRRQNGCISDAAASSLERLTRGCTNCLCVVTSAASAARSSVVRGGARDRAPPPGIVYISQEARIRVSESDEYAYLNSRG